MRGSTVVPALPWALMIVALWFLYPLRDFYMLGLEDEAVLLYSSHRILEGQFPHTEFFTPLPPLTMVLVSAWWWVVGESLQSARFLLTGVMAAAALLLYFLGRRILPPTAAAAASLLFLTEMVSWTAWSQNWLNVLVYLVTVLLLVRHAEKPGKLSMAFAGAGAGICLLTTQYIGAVAMVLATIVAFTELDWATRRRRLLELYLGTASVLAPCLLIYAWAGALSEMWQQQFVFPFFGYAGFNKFPYQLFPNLEVFRGGLTALQGFSLEQAWQARGSLLDFFTWPARTLLVHTLFYPLTLIFLAAGVVRWWTTGERVLCILAVGQLGLSLATLTRPDAPHLAFARTLWWVLLVALLLEVWRRASRGVRWTVGPLTGVLLVAVLAQGWVHRTRWAEAAYGVRFPREVLRVREPQVAQALAATVALIEKSSRPGDAIFIYPWNPAFYFLTGRENPAWTDRLLPFYDSPEQFERVFAQLESADDRLKAVLLFNINLPVYLSQYPTVPAAEFEQLYRGFEQRLQERFGERVLRAPF